MSNSPAGRVDKGEASRPIWLQWLQRKSPMAVVSSKLLV